MRHNPGLTVTFRGVRGSIPTPAQQNLAFGGNTTCLEVRSGDGDLLMIDAGSGARQLGLELVDEFAGRSLDLHVLFTHFHWDHIQGLPFFAPLEGAANRVTFHSTRPAGELREILSGQMHKPYYPISFDDMSARREFAQMDDRPARLGNIVVHPFALNHPQGATGYRLETEAR